MKRWIVGLVAAAFVATGGPGLWPEPARAAAPVSVPVTGGPAGTSLTTLELAGLCSAAALLLLVIGLCIERAVVGRSDADAPDPR